MHEASLCHNLLHQIEAVMRQHPGSRIKEVYVEIGPLSGIAADEFTTAFYQACLNSEAEGARLQLKTVLLKLHCRQCGDNADAEAGRQACQHCGSEDTVPLNGDELTLTNVILEDESDHA